MKKIVQGIVFLLPFIIFSQSQVGNSINGEENNDLSGNSISLSADGNTIAVGAYLNDGNGDKSGQVRVFQNTNGVWSKIGQDIDGENSGDQLGKSVALSADGKIVAIGVPWNDTKGINAGQVSIYKNTNGVWKKFGNDIYGKRNGNQLGYAISLTNDGTTVAIGAPQNSENGKFAGQVQVYNYNNGYWQLIGQPIDGKSVGDLAGLSVNLSSKGDVIAIGSTRNSDKGEAAGQVRVFKNVNNNWTQLGNAIYGSSEGDQFGTSVSLADNGNVIAIGAARNDGSGKDSGQVRVYRNIGEIWDQIGDDINGKAEGDISGWRVSLSADAKILAIGAPQNGENGKFAGQVRLYKNFNNIWIKIGRDIYGDSMGNNLGSSVCVSSNGKFVAIGAPSNKGNGKFRGQVKVYNLASFGPNEDAVTMKSASIETIDNSSASLQK